LSKNRHWLVILPLLILILALQLLHFHKNNYRQDEAWVVHGVMERDFGNILQWLVHPPGYTYFLKLWVAAAGHQEFATRFSSTLFTLLGLSLLYRLILDKLNYKVALYAVFILGTISFFQFYSHETRPYAALICWTVGMHWSLNRWLQTRKHLYTVILFACGLMALYTHFFAVLYVMALGFYLFFFETWYRRSHWMLIAVFAALTISFVAWFMMILQADSYISRGGIRYGLASENALNGLLFLYSQMQTRPAELGLVLLLVGILVPIYEKSQLRFLKFDLGNLLRVQALFIPGSILLISFAINSYVNVLTPRNLIIILPTIAILIAIALAHLSWRFSVVASLFFLIPAMISPIRYVSNGPYREILAIFEANYQAGEAIVIEAAEAWQHVPIIYYFEKETSLGLDNGSFTHFVSPNNINYLAMPEPPLNWIDSTTETGAFLDSTPERVWWIQVADGADEAKLSEDRLNELYIAQRGFTFTEPDWDWPHTVTEYRRIPDTLSPMVYFGDELSLRHWQLETVSLHPCESLNLESWWLAESVPSNNYSMTMVLADANGNGIINVDGSPANILTGLWEANRYYLDERSINIPCDFATGDYPLLLSIYDPVSSERLSTRDKDGNPIAGLVYLTTIQIR
jgi:hypothetical protein